MIITLIAFGVLIAGIILIIIDINSYIPTVLEAISVPLLIVGIFVSAMFGIISLASADFDGAGTARQNEIRKSIIYQVNNKTYLNDNNVGTVELMNQIGKFNGDIYSGRIGRQNPWTSWLYPEWTLHVEPIDMDW